MLKQISLFNLVGGLFFIAVPLASAEQTSVVQIQKVSTESGKSPVVEQQTVTSTSSTTPTPNSITTINPEQLLKTLMNSTAQPSSSNTIQIPSSVTITLPANP